MTPEACARCLRLALWWVVLAMRLPAAQHPADEVNRTVDEVLSRTAFRASQPSVLDQGLAWLLEQLNRFLNLLRSNDASQVALAFGLVSVAVGLVVATVWFLRRFQRSGNAPTAAVVGSAGRSGAEWEAAAAAAEHSGDLRESLRCSYRALVADFSAAGVLDELPGRTAGQYLAEVRRDLPPADGAFSRATAAFEHAWYGRGPVSREDVQAMRSAVADARGALAAAGMARMSRAGGRLAAPS